MCCLDDETGALISYQAINLSLLESAVLIKNTESILIVLVIR